MAVDNPDWSNDVAVTKFMTQTSGEVEGVSHYFFSGNNSGVFTSTAFTVPNNYVYELVGITLFANDYSVLHQVDLTSTEYGQMWTVTFGRTVDIRLWNYPIHASYDLKIELTLNSVTYGGGTLVWVKVKV